MGKVYHARILHKTYLLMGKYYFFTIIESSISISGSKLYFSEANTKNGSLVGEILK